MRAIDATAAKKHFRRVGCTGEYKGVLHIVVPISEIDKCPTITYEDLVPHGRWEYVRYDDGVHPKDVYRCTNCGAEKKVTSRKYLEPEKFCYNCGAAMRDGGKDK